MSSAFHFDPVAISRDLEKSPLAGTGESLHAILEAARSRPERVELVMPDLLNVAVKAAQDRDYHPAVDKLLVSIVAACPSRCIPAFAEIAGSKDPGASFAATRILAMLYAKRCLPETQDEALRVILQDLAQGEQRVRAVSQRAVANANDGAIAAQSRLLLVPLTAAEHNAAFSTASSDYMNPRRAGILSLFTAHLIAVQALKNTTRTPRGDFRLFDEIYYELSGRFDSTAHLKPSQKVEELERATNYRVEVHYGLDVRRPALRSAVRYLEGTPRWTQIRKWLSLDTITDGISGPRPREAPSKFEYALYRIRWMHTLEACGMRGLFAIALDRLQTQTDTVTRIRAELEEDPDLLDVKATI